MIKSIWCNYNAVSQEERAKAILFGGADPKEFVPMFIWEGKQYYKRIR